MYSVLGLCDAKWSIENLFDTETEAENFVHTLKTLALFSEILIVQLADDENVMTARFIQMKNLDYIKIVFS